MDYEVRVFDVRGDADITAMQGAFKEWAAQGWRVAAITPCYWEGCYAADGGFQDLWKVMVTFRRQLPRPA